MVKGLSACWITARRKPADIKQNLLRGKGHQGGRALKKKILLSAASEFPF